MISYAQNFEDVILARALGDRPNGFYVDVGACFPDVASVTRHFYELGWNGINIEPMVEPFERLQAERPRDINVRGAVASFTGEIPIYSGASVGESSALRPFDTARAILVPCFTLADLCDRYATRPIDFLKIDVEGLEDDVVKSGDWVRFRPAVVIVEVTIPWSTRRRPDASEIGAFLRGKDYDEVYFDGLNAFFLAREAASLAPRFAAPPNVLDRFTVAREAELEAATARLQAHAESVGKRLAEVDAHAKAAERETTALAGRATAAELLMRQSEHTNAELRDALREKETLLLNAQRAWQDGVATVERMQAKLDRELQAAERRAGQLTQASAEAAQRAESAARDANAAMTAARAAEARAKEADASAHAAEAKALQEAVRAQQALADAAHAGACAEQAEVRAQREAARAQEAEARAIRAEANATDLEARSRESDAREHRAVGRALQAEHTIASMLRSRSWRVTAPLRAVADLIRGARGVPAPTLPARRVPLSIARAGVLRRARSLAKQTSLYHWLAPRLKQRYPRLWMRARAIVLENPSPALLTVPSPAASHVPASADVRTPGTAPGAISAEATIEELTSLIKREIARRRSP